MAKKVIAEHYTISSGKVTHAMIEEAQKIITSLMTAEDVCEFNELLMKLFMTIPRKMQNVKDYIAKSKNDFDSIIHKEQDLLDVMSGQVYTADEDTNNSTDTNFKVPTDNYLKNLGLFLKFALVMILTLLKNFWVTVHLNLKMLGKLQMLRLEKSLMSL